MPIYEIATDHIRKIAETTFGAAGIKERADLQRLLRSQIDIISPDTLVISEEFCEWDESKRRIDLLGLDKDANLVVIELKRTEDGGHMELQALRYAAMISAMTFDKVIEVYGDYLKAAKSNLDPRTSVLGFLGWTEPNEDVFAQDVRIVLASAEFSKELTTTVLWLNECGLDIRCVRLKPYQDNGRVLVDIQPIIPLPEAQEFQIKIKEKQQRERQARTLTAQTIDETIFVQEMLQSRGANECAVAKRIIEWAKNQNLGLTFTKRKVVASFIPSVECGNDERSPITLQTGGKIYFQMTTLRKYPPFDDEMKRTALWERLNRIPNVSVDKGQMMGEPNILIGALSNDASLASFLETLTWVVSELRSSTA